MSPRASRWPPHSSITRERGLPVLACSIFPGLRRLDMADVWNADVVVVSTYRRQSPPPTTNLPPEGREREAEVVGATEGGSSSGAFRVVRPIWRNVPVRNIAGIFLSEEPVCSIPFCNQTRESVLGAGPTHYVPPHSRNQTHPSVRGTRVVLFC